MQEAKTPTGRRTHWDTVYRTKDETAVSWFQAHPERSLSWIRSAAPSRSASIIDVGGGASRLVDALQAGGYRDLAVLDVSEEAVTKARARLKAGAGGISWIVADVTSWKPERTWDVWHDRAVFHFLTDAADQSAYITALTRATRPDAKIVISCFALNGPEKCSGLPVQRYSAATLAARLGDAFRLVRDEAESHTTPSGNVQNFIYALFERKRDE